MFEIRKLENLHILFWLLKDISWLMFWRELGILMIIPTFGFSIFIAWKSRDDLSSFLPNLAVSCWILANSFWMVVEFFEYEDQLKHYAAIPFFCGLMLICYYYARIFIGRLRRL